MKAACTTHQGWQRERNSLLRQHQYEGIGESNDVFGLNSFKTASFERSNPAHVLDSCYNQPTGPLTAFSLDRPAEHGHANTFNKLWKLGCCSRPAVNIPANQGLLFWAVVQIHSRFMPARSWNLFLLAKSITRACPGKSCSPRQRVRYNSEADPKAGPTLLSLATKRSCGAALPDVKSPC